MSSLTDTAGLVAADGQTSAVEPLLTPRELARLLGVSLASVYRHADALGGFRLPVGNVLRFHWPTTLALLTARERSERSRRPASPVLEPKPKRRSRRRSGDGRQLLPVHGECDHA